MIFDSGTEKFQSETARKLYTAFCEALNSKFEAELYAKDLLIKAYEYEVEHITKLYQSEKLKNIETSEISGDRKCEK